MDWERVREAATFGLSRRRLSEAGKPSWSEAREKALPWAANVLIGLVGCWLVGFLTATAFELWGQGNEGPGYDAASWTGDVIYPALLGFAIFAAGVWTVRVVMALVESREDR